MTRIPMTHSSITPPPLPGQLGLQSTVCLLAISQTVGYGTVFYSYAIVAPHMAAEFGVSAAAPFTVISIAMLLAGLAGPQIGRLVDRLGGPRVMQVGSAAVAGLYLLLALSPAFLPAAVLVILLQVVAVSVLYGAAFPTLALFGRDRGKRGIVWLGLLGGFSSSIFWPLSGWLVAELGWRPTFALFALLHLALALPAHRHIARRVIVAEPEVAPTARPHRAARNLSPRLAFWLIALAFGLTGIVSTALLVHLVPILGRITPGAQAFAAAALAGPAMMLSRLTEAVLWPRAHPIWSACLSALAFPLALTSIIAVPEPQVAAVLFSVLYGIGHGLGVTSAGTLPLRVFGTRGYGELLGRLGAVRVVMSAAGPALLAIGLQDADLFPSLIIGFILSLAGLAPLLVLAGLLLLPAPPSGDKT